jgi:hypothetical protein
MSLSPENVSPLSHGRDLSARAASCAQWFRHVARAVKSARLYRIENPMVEQLREQSWLQLEALLKEHGAWRLRITSDEIRLEDEVVVKGPHRAPGQEHVFGGPEEHLPFLFYGDGIRGLTLLPKLQKREFESFFEALVLIGKGRNTQDDLMTLLWQANLGAIVLESVPPEQTIYLSSRRPVSQKNRGHRGQAFAWGATGTEIRADLGSVVGGQGLHRDTFDDWRLPDVHAHSTQAYRALLPQVEASRERFKRQWSEEQSQPWPDQIATFIRCLLVADGSPEMRSAVGHGLVTWLGTSLQRASWDDAERALGVIREIDPDRVHTETEIADMMAGLEGEVIAGQLDESDPNDQARFAALALAIGRPAVGLACMVMSLCERARPRAAATTALCFLCNDEPALLQPWIQDPRWYVVRNVVLVLGQIGGSGVVELLRQAADHPEPRVRREVVRALGSVSRAERTPILIQQLGTKDPQLISATLQLLIRERHPRVVKVLLDRIEARDFESLSEGVQHAFINALAEVADDAAVPALQRLLTRDGGWFAMRTPTRDAAARILHRIGSEAAMAVLEAGLRSKTQVIRLACLGAMEQPRKSA